MVPQRFIEVATKFPVGTIATGLEASGNKNVFIVVGYAKTSSAVDAVLLDDLGDIKKGFFNPFKDKWISPKYEGKVGDPDKLNWEFEDVFGDSESYKIRYKPEVINKVLQDAPNPDCYWDF